ncbi:MAG: hypothetical protein VXW32_10565 [Myxococcota bacterium]|nr:hypothetical protein [Myxococcota bacterium]
MFWSRRIPLSLFLAVGIYGVLALTTVNNVGIVGEVDGTWALEFPPKVLVGWENGLPVWGDGSRSGPFVASQVRPLERLDFGGLQLPLAVNHYTGGLADWPARATHALTGSLEVVRGVHLFLGGLLLVLMHRFLRFHGTDIAAAVAAIVLASDWNFVFYRKVLGGTEVLLQAAGLLVLWAMWSRRWGGGKHGSTAIAVGVGLGFLAKATFLPTLLALSIVALATRKDHPAIRPPFPIRPLRMAGIVLLLTSPLWFSWLHHSHAFEEALHIRSHDYLGLQTERAWHGLFQAGASRESAVSLWSFLSTPFPWLEGAYQTETPSAGPPWRSLALLIPLTGSVLAWRDRSESRPRALLRFMSLFVPLQVLLIWLSNKDLHHLAQAAVPMAIWVGLATDRLCALITPPRSPKRAFYSLLLSVPWLLGGSTALQKTDEALATTPIHTFTQSGQTELTDWLRSHRVNRLWTTDYDLSGMLEVHLPGVHISHAWGDVSRRGQEALPDLLKAAKEGHYLTVRPSAPMIYNLRPSADQLDEIAAELGIEIEPVAALHDARGSWAELYALR